MRPHERPRGDTFLEQRHDDGQLAVTFDGKALLIGVAAAALLSAVGLYRDDPVIQWYLPGGIVLLAFAFAILRPPKRAAGEAPEARD